MTAQDVIADAGGGKEAVSDRSYRPLLTGQRWYLAYTAPHKEASAGQRLEAQGFRTFLPNRLKTVRHARKLRTVRAPLFPSYIFVALDLDRDRWRSVNGTIGVASLIMANERPLPLPRGVVETLLMSSDERGEVRFTSNLQPGQHVQLIAGPFAQALGVLESLDDKGRVEVLLEIMGGGIKAKLPREWIEVVGK
jgi:transcriptional antiterminator RfaH